MEAAEATVAVYHCRPEKSTARFDKTRDIFLHDSFKSLLKLLHVEKKCSIISMAAFAVQIITEALR